MTHPAPNPALKALYDFWADMGALDPDEAPPPSTGARTARPPARSTPSESAPQPGAQGEAGARPEPRRLVTNPVAEARRVAAAAKNLLELKTAIEGFDGCALKKAARNTVAFDGSVDADVMIVGEAPGAEEDQKGLPFVGKAGQLLDRMLASIGLSRASNIYITNTIYWRPPGNRDPAPDEIQMCLPFLMRQIELKKPKLLLTAGKPATQTLLKTDDGIMRLRGRKTVLRLDGMAPIPCVPMLHPAYLLRRPADKAKAWTDMLTIAGACDDLGIKRGASL